MKIRVAPSLGRGFERSFEEAWGLEVYDGVPGPAVFAGIYGLPDFYTLWRHKGKKYIFWAGSDIRHLHKGYWLDETGTIRLNSKGIALWINQHCESWVENKLEQLALKSLGINSKVCPSYLGDVNKMEISYKQSDRPKLYSSVSGDNFDLYGWYKIDKLAEQYRDVKFHLYGNIGEFNPRNKNVIVHGRVPNEQMNAEIKEMQGAIRMIPLEGFSEIVAKSILMGQYPVSVIPYEHCLLIEQIDEIKDKKEPNLAGREYYIKELNNYPFNKNK